MHNNDNITSDDVLEMEDALTEHCLPKIWVKLAHAYTADTRLSSPSPCVLLESLGTRLLLCVMKLLEPVLLQEAMK